MKAEEPGTLQSETSGKQPPSSPAEGMGLSKRLVHGWSFQERVYPFISRGHLR